MSASTFDFPDHCGPQLVPASAWNSNLRAVLSAARWRDFRQAVFAKHGPTCAFCGARPKSLDCHEIWSYSIESDATAGRQSLVKVLPLCKSCHMVCHIGFWSLQGKFDVALAHMMRVRKINRTAALAEITAANAVFEHLSRFDWILDIESAKAYVERVG